MPPETVAMPEGAPDRGRGPATSDFDLAGRARGGDRVAFRELYLRYEAYVYWLVLRIVGRPEESADVAQETWLRVHQRLRDLRDPGTFRGWLRAVAIRCALDARRRAPGRREVPAEAMAPPAAAGAALRHELEQALRSLPGDLRSVVVLHDVEGMAHPEVARHLGISEVASRTRLSRGRRRLREVLGR